MYTKEMKESLDLNRRFVASLSDNELDDLMREFDQYQVEEIDFFYNNKSFNNYLNFTYKKFELFSLFEKERKSINLDKDIQKDLTEGPFLFC